LAEQYLLPQNRRQGLFVVTRHGAKSWKDPVTGQTWNFQDLCGWLAAEAGQVVRNRTGGVEVRVAGLDPGTA
jgi:hypothetical protein